MKVFLIIVGVLFLLGVIICSLSATFTIIYDNKWKTTIQVLWIEKDIELTKLLSFILFPEKAAEKVKNKNKDEETAEQPEEKIEKPEEKKQETVTITDSETGETVAEIKSENAADDKSDEQKADEPKTDEKPKKPNFIQKMWDKGGIVEIMEFVTNLLETAGSAINALFRGFHIYSLYVKIIVGGGDAYDIANTYGKICKYYYPLKGIILNGMRVDNCDDMIMPDFIAPSSEYGLQLIGSLSVGALLKMVLKAGKTFVINIIKK